PSRPARMLPSVDLPAPLGPMMACTWPGFTSSERPLRMSRSPMRACRFSILSMGLGIRDWGFGKAGSDSGVGEVAVANPQSRIPNPGKVSPASADGTFQRHVQQLLGLHRELHRQLAEDLLAEAIDDQAHRVLLGDAAGTAVEHLVVADLGGGGLVLDGRGRVLHLDVGEGVRAALLADQQAVALGVVARALGAGGDLDQAAVGVLAAAGADALADDLALGALADVDHLGAGVGLLAVVGERDRVELA